MKEKIIKFICKNKKYFLCIIIIILSIVSIIIQQLNRNNSIVINSEKLEEKEGKIVVYVTGEIKNPGVYYLENNARLYNLIDIAGGLLETADTDKINLAQKLEDSQKIVISPKKDEVYESEEDTSDNELYEEKTTQLVNINEATKDELKKLNGIGESTANKIIEYRKNNLFKSIDEIMNVPGIGSSKFENIKDYICVN